MTYKEEYSSSISNPKTYWKNQADKINWIKKPESILSESSGEYSQWYTDGIINTCDLCLDQQVKEGRGDQIALIYDSPVTQTIKKLTYKELLDQVSFFAGALKNIGLNKGDLVIIYMPMIPETMVAMLACARLGAVHSVVFGGFAATELASRIDDAKPKFILTATCGIEGKKIIDYMHIINEALEKSNHQPEQSIIFERDQLKLNNIGPRQIKWIDVLNQGENVPCTPLSSNDPLYILYTSGTTGKPKGVVRDNGGHAVALKFSMEKIYNIKAGEVFWAASDVGWVVGHSYIVYAPLIMGCTTILFEGKPIGTPDAGTFWRIIAEHKVNIFFTAPTAFRAIKKEDPQGSLKENYDCSSLRAIYLAGERTDPATYTWLNELSKLPVVDHWWQTESGYPMIANPYGIEPQPFKAGSASLPVPGFDIQILDEDGVEKKPNEQGAVVIRLPLPPGCLLTIHNNPEYFNKCYLEKYPGYYLSGDGGYKDEDGYIFIMGRMDDIINIAGHRLSTGEMEEIVASHPAVAECAVVGTKCELKGEVPIVLAVLKNGQEITQSDLSKELKIKIREGIGPIATIKSVSIVNQLPKTRSGKILRNVIRSIANKEKFKIPPTILDSAAIEEAEVALSLIDEK
ncbi:MAG: propionyl-CoA synthetase [Planctomycetota bacterium]|nr:MAG: propionyl-CoA synthetase [Planctomycetota bacterium]